MASKILPHFDNEQYSRLVDERKCTYEPKIVVDETKKQKPNDYKVDVPIKHISVDNPMYLIAECNKLDSTKFGFKLT